MVMTTTSMRIVKKRVAFIWTKKSRDPGGRYDRGIEHQCCIARTKEVIISMVIQTDDEGEDG